MTRVSVLDFYNDDEESAQKFWKKHIGYGKVLLHLEKCRLKLGETSDDFSKYLEWRKRLARSLGGTVHTSISTAFMTIVTPTVYKTRPLLFGVLGHPSAFSRSTLDAASTSIWHFMESIMATLINPVHLEQRSTFKLSPKNKVHVETVIATLVFQELAQRYILKTIETQKKEKRPTSL